MSSISFPDLVPDQRHTAESCQGTENKEERRQAGSGMYHLQHAATCRKFV